MIYVPHLSIQGALPSVHHPLPFLHGLQSDIRCRIRHGLPLTGHKNFEIAENEPGSLPEPLL